LKIRGPGSDADGNLAGGDVTTAMYLLAFLDLLASDRRPATVEAAAPAAGTSLGSSERTTAFDYSRYRYDGAHSLRSADGGAQELVGDVRKGPRGPSAEAGAGGQCQFPYSAEGWGKAYRFIALRYLKKDETPKPQYQLFDTPKYIYRVFVTNMKGPIDLLVWVYNQRAGAENLIKEANNDAGLAAHPSEQWAANCVHFQLAMLAYNLNCWLLLFNREEKVQANDLKHTTLVTARLRFLFVAAKI